MSNQAAAVVLYGNIPLACDRARSGVQRRIEGQRELADVQKRAARDVVHIIILDTRDVTASMGDRFYFFSFKAFGPCFSVHRIAEPAKE